MSAPVSGVQAEPVSRRTVPPDPAVASALGRHHTLPTAVADLVDNALDAGARNVLVRFVLSAGRATGLQVIDDGQGMDSGAADAAMTYARRRDYGTGELGHFGIGLKAASLSQARTLVVWSRAAGTGPVGRRLRRETLDTGPVVESYATNDARSALERTDLPFSLVNGTVIEWHDVDSFLRSPDLIEQTAWLEDTVDRLVTHLGLVLHRILERSDVRLTIEEHEDGFAGAPRVVVPVDPFGYQGSVSGYPVNLLASLPDGEAPVRAHVWPANERRSAAFHTGDGDGSGLYVYRRDRLLQPGGWNGLAHGPDLELARLAIELDEPVEQHVTFNPEKTGVVLDHTLTEAIAQATSTSGTTFHDVLALARNTSREARRRRGRPISVVPPRFGVPPSIRDAYDEATERIVGEEPFDIRWRNLPLDQFYEIDRDERVLKVNARYRKAIAGKISGRKNDAPLVKTLLHLLLADHLTSTKNGSRMKRETAAWQELLVAAALDQQTELDGRTDLGP